MIFIYENLFPHSLLSVLCPSVVERVRSQWDGTQHGVEARLQQLDNMTGHSNQWEEQRKEVKALIGHHEGRFHNLLQQSRDPLTKQLADNKVREIILHVLWVFHLSFLRLQLCGYVDLNCSFVNTAVKDVNKRPLCLITLKANYHRGFTSSMTSI